MRRGSPIRGVRAPAPAAGPSDEAGVSHTRFQTLLDQLLASRCARDGAVLLLTESAVRLAAQPGCEARVEELLEAVSVDPWHLCQTVHLLIRHAQRLPTHDFQKLVVHCLEALQHLSAEDREDLLEDLAREGFHDFLHMELELSLTNSAPHEIAAKVSDRLRRFPPSARAQLDLDGLTLRCLAQMGPNPTTEALDHLLQTIALRDLREDAPREALAAAYAYSLEPEQVQPRHRDRCAYLARYAIEPATRARLLIRHDLARVATLSENIRDPELVLEKLTHFPQVLSSLPAVEATAMVGLILARLARHLTDEDHLRIGRTLCDPERPEPFFDAYLPLLYMWAQRASDPVRLEIWRELFAAWLSPRAGALAPVLRPLLRSLFGALERDVRRQLSHDFRARFGRPLRVLLELNETPPGLAAGRRWIWPWPSRLSP